MYMHVCKRAYTNPQGHNLCSVLILRFIVSRSALHVDSVVALGTAEYVLLAGSTSEGPGS